MPENKACYRSLHRYKYQLMNEYIIETGVQFGVTIDTDFIALTSSGQLTIKRGYAWDGPSGPVIHTRSFMRGSLVHDALYQLMRRGYLDCGEHRKEADKLLRKICIEDGMLKFRAWYVYQAVRLYAKGDAVCVREEEDEIICVP